jgi:ribose transport system substrate-binding protein
MVSVREPNNELAALTEGGKQMQPSLNQTASTWSIRKRRWRTWTILTLALALLGLVGCGSSSPAAKTNAQSGKPVKMGILLPDLTISTLSATYSGAKEEAKKLGVTLVESGSTNTSTFVSDCQEMLASGVQVIAYDTFDSPGTAACVSAANQAHVKVICLYSCSPGHNDGNIAFEYSVGGKLIGQWMAQQLVAEKKYQVAMLEGPPGDTVAPLMENEFKKVLAAGCPKCQIVTIGTSNEDENSAYQAALPILSAHPSLNAVYAFQDNMGLGVEKAVEQQGLTGKVLVASFNGACPAIASVLTNHMGLTILFPGQPYGAAAVQAGVDLVRGQKVPPNKTILVAIDHTLATGILNGSVAETPTYKLVDLKGVLQAAQAGCK